MNARARQAWTVLAAALIAQIAVSVVNQGLPVLTPFLRQSLHLNYAQAGFLGTSMYLGGIVSTVLSGWAADALGQRRVLIAGAALTGLLVLLASRADAFVWIAVLLAATGIGASTPTPAGSKAVMSWFPQARWGLAMGVRQTGIPLGGAVAAATLPLLAALYDWHLALVVAGGVALLGAGLCAVLYRHEDPPWTAAQARPSHMRPWDVLTVDIGLLAAAGALLVTGQFVLITYLPSYLQAGWHIPIVSGALYVLIAQLTGAGGRVFWGSASDRWFRGRRKPALIVIGLAASGSVFALAHLPGVAVPALTFALVALFGFVGLGWNGLYVTLASELSGRERAGSAVGVVLMATQFGIIAGPTLFGHIIDVTHSYRIAWTALAAVLLAGTACLVRIRERQAANPSRGYSAPLPQGTGGR